MIVAFFTKFSHLGATFLQILINFTFWEHYQNFFKRLKRDSNQNGHGVLKHVRKKTTISKNVRTYSNIDGILSEKNIYNTSSL